MHLPSGKCRCYQHPQELAGKLLLKGEKKCNLIKGIVFTRNFIIPISKVDEFPSSKVAIVCPPKDRRGGLLFEIPTSMKSVMLSE